MEVEAKGQLGGLECSASERERMAGASGAWKCSICGESNEEVLKESEGRWREMEGDGAKREEVAVPGELKIVYKDELEEGKGKEKASEEKEEDDEEANELAEGFVATYPKAEPAQSVAKPTASSLTPTPTQPLPQARAPPQARPPQTTAPPNIALAYQEPTVAQVLSNEGVPAWIDMCIAGVVLGLVVMILKILLGL